MDRQQLCMSVSVLCVDRSTGFSHSDVRLDKG